MPAFESLIESKKLEARNPLRDCLPSTSCLTPTLVPPPPAVSPLLPVFGVICFEGVGVARVGKICVFKICDYIRQTVKAFNLKRGGCSAPCF